MTDSSIKWNKDMSKNGATFLIIISILLFSFRFSFIKEEKRKKKTQKRKTQKKQRYIRETFKNKK